MPKTLSFKQPWAELILMKRKTIDTRTWNTKFRGTFYIHASKSVDKEAMKRFGFSGLETGKVVGKAELAEVITFSKQSWKTDKRTLANWMQYRKYGFVLKNIKRIRPFALKGRLGFFEAKFI